MGSVIVFILADFAGIGFVIGFLAIAFGYDRLYIIPRVLRKGLKAKGTVIEMREDPGPLFGNRKSKGVAPVVEFTSLNGNVYKYYSMTYRQNTPYKVGDQVDIWYKHYKSRRDAALMDDEPYKWARTVIVVGISFLVISLLLLLPGIGSMFFSRGN